MEPAPGFRNLDAKLCQDPCIPVYLHIRRTLQAAGEAPPSTQPQEMLACPSYPKQRTDASVSLRSLPVVLSCLAGGGDYTLCFGCNYLVRTQASSASTFVKSLVCFSMRTSKSSRARLSTPNHGRGICCNKDQRERGNGFVERTSVLTVGRLGHFLKHRGLLRLFLNSCASIVDIRCCLPGAGCSTATTAGAMHQPPVGVSRRFANTDTTTWLELRYKTRPMRQ